MVRFCPQLQKLSLTQSEVTDLSPLRGLARLESLSMYNRKVEDLRPIASLTPLRSLLLNIDCPWPDMEGFEALEALTDFTYAGNILVLRGIPRLAAVRHAKIDQTGDFHVPLPSVSELPEMPELRTLYLENTWKLDGLDRYPRLLNLKVYGYQPDLAPLASLRHATTLFLSGGTYESLAPLAGMTELRHLTIRREEPLDYTPLAAMPHLHEVTFELCPSSKMEIATL